MPSWRDIFDPVGYRREEFNGCFSSQVLYRGEPVYEEEALVPWEEYMRPPETIEDDIPELYIFSGKLGGYPNCTVGIKGKFRPGVPSYSALFYDTRLSIINGYGPLKYHLENGSIKKLKQRRI